MLHARSGDRVATGRRATNCAQVATRPTQAAISYNLVRILVATGCLEVAELFGLAALEELLHVLPPPAETFHDGDFRR